MMKELEDTNPLAALKNNIWQAMNLIRGFVDGNEFHFVLFLLTLHRKGVLKDVVYGNEGNLELQIDEALQKMDTDTGEDLRAIFPIYDRTIRKANPNVVYELISFFKSIDQEVLEKNFAVIFDDILYNISKWQGRAGGESVLPFELSRFACSLVELPAHAQVYNPFGGFASFGVLLPKKALYLGQEKNYTTWAIGLLRLMAHDKKEYSFFRLGDSILEWGMIISPPDEISKKENYQERFLHDLVIANPPFGMLLTKNEPGKFGNIRNCEHFLIEKSLEVLKENGQLVALISDGFLFRGGAEQNLRQYLVEQDLLEMVISFPGGLLHNTSIPISMLVINKKKSRKGVVRFIDAKAFVTSNPASEKKLNDSALSLLIKSGEESDYSKFVSPEIIKENNFNLNVPRYFSKIFEGVELRELLTSIRGQKTNYSAPGKIIRVKDLRSDKFDYKLVITPSDNIETLSGEQEVSESCLLIAAAGEKLKPTYFNYTGTSIFVSSNIHMFRVNEEAVDLDYLISELYTDQAIEQISSLSIGSSMPKLRKDDFLSIKIQVPGPLEQRAKVKGLKQEHIRSKEKELSLQREILGLKDEAFREFASIKHTLRQYLNALKSNVSGTRKFIAKNEDKSINLKTLYSKNLNQNLGEHLLGLENIIDSMSKLLLISEEQPGDESIKVFEMEMELSTLIKDAQKRFKDPEVFQFEELFIDQESLAFPDGDGGYIGTYINVIADDFYRIFSNIISNAVDHGFKNRTNNIIRTSLSFNSETNKLIVEISNNGNPIAKGFTLKHLTTRGEKTVDSLGSGIGGADIKTLLDKYDALLDIKNDDTDDFPVTYILQFDLAITVF